MATTVTATEERDQPRSWIKPYYTSFNGLRGTAVLMVFLSHYAGFWGASTLESFTWVGVDLFFVLSGFLITGILYDSLESPHYFHNFYVRRALRIFPPYYALFLLLFALTVPLHLHYPLTLTSFAFYVGNWFVPFVDTSGHNPTIISILHHGHSVEVANIGHFWSLCLEEQFYLLWPTVMWFVRDKGKLLWFSGLLILIGPVERFLLARHVDLSRHVLLMQWSTFTRYDTLLIGAWLALWLRGRTLTRSQLRRISLCLFWIPLAALVVGERLFGNGFGADALLFNTNHFLFTIGYSLIALCCVGVLMHSLDELSLLSRAMCFRPLSALGLISYGFYLIHRLPQASLTAWAVHAAWLTPWIPGIAFIFTITLAMLSFRYLESPFLRLKKRLAPEPADKRKAVSSGFGFEPLAQQLP